MKYMISAILDGWLQIKLSAQEMPCMYNSFMLVTEVAARVVLMHSLSIAKTAFGK